MCKCVVDLNQNCCASSLPPTPIENQPLRNPGLLFAYSFFISLAASGWFEFLERRMHRVCAYVSASVHQRLLVRMVGDIYIIYLLIT